MLVKKLGQPVPLSNFICEVNKGSVQPAQTNTPARFSPFKALEKGRSVASLRKTANWGSGRTCRHSASVRCSGAVDCATSAPLAKRTCQFCRISASGGAAWVAAATRRDRKSTRLNSSHVSISYAVFCLKKKNKINQTV